MAKINEEHMAKLFSGFGLNSQSAVPQAPLPSVDTTPAPQAEPQNQTVSQPRKKQKTDRVSFMCRISETNLMKIRMLSATSGRSLSDFIDQSVSTFLADYETKNGNILSRT